ncbi:DUF1648 domain-containing protein [Citricoccus sp. GCM10030269]|uniref:DUF1648 domain-containing protein n=1 Tax=Citricoccus sp. GCM10030269 TaxID=3273388 RepID=UPI00361F5F94
MTDDDGSLTELRRGRAAAWTPFLLAAVVLAGLFAWGSQAFSHLPEVFPTHWGPSGEPDAWEEKSFGTVFIGPLSAAGTTALMGLLALLVPAMLLPPKDSSAWGRVQQEGRRRATVSVLGWVSLLTAIFVGALSVQTWTAPGEISMTVPLTLYMLGLGFAIVLPFRRWQRWSQRWASEAGLHPSPEEAAEEKLWLPGGIYNNPDEPRVLVPKREGLGTGLTVNVGHRNGRLAVGVFVVLMIAFPVALTLVAS